MSAACTELVNASPERSYRTNRRRFKLKLLSFMDAWPRWQFWQANHRHLRSHKESQHAGSKCLSRTVLAETIEELVWQAVSELLRNPQVLIEQYNQRPESGYGTP